MKDKKSLAKSSAYTALATGGAGWVLLILVLIFIPALICQAQSNVGILITLFVFSCVFLLICSSASIGVGVILLNMCKTSDSQFLTNESLYFNKFLVVLLTVCFNIPAGLLLFFSIQSAATPSKDYIALPSTTYNSNHLAQVLSDLKTLKEQLKNDIITKEEYNILVNSLKK